MMESNEEVTYPSISVCSSRQGEEYHNRSDLSLFQRSANLSNTIKLLKWYQKSDTGHIQKMSLTPSNGELENRDLNDFFVPLCTYFLCVVILYFVP